MSKFSPIRSTRRSISSSQMSRLGWRLRSNDRIGATCSRPRRRLVLIRKVPRGSLCAADNDSNIDSTFSRIFCAQTNAASPSLVMLTRRVVRLNSFTPNSVSRVAMRLLTWAGDRPVSVAAAMKLERRATSQNN
ncbi:hypothetical protein D3C84_962340 [compost metagenome]